MLTRSLALTTAALAALCPTLLAQTTVGVEGLYADQPGYDPGDTIRIHANWTPTIGPDARVKYRLVRFDAAGPVPVGSETGVFLHAGDQTTPFGSFVEYPPTLQLAGRTAFTLEGWVQPTLIGDGLNSDDDWTAIAGQLNCANCATWNVGSPFPVGGSAGVGVSGDGRPFAFVDTDETGRSFLLGDEQLPIRNAQGRLTWTYVAATFGGGELKLYVGDPGNWREIKSTPARGRIVDRGLPFRLGARSEAPADRSGCFDGRLDDWSVWGVPLNRNQLNTRRAPSATDGKEQRDVPRRSSLSSTSTGIEPQATAGLPLLMRAEFEDPYGTQVADTSGAGQHGTLVHHGTPGMGGHTLVGQALRLNHDQVVDAQWTDHAREETSGLLQPVEITIPLGAQSGLYGIQALVDDGAGFDPSNRNQERWHAIVVRPLPSATPAPVALIMPINTWMAYNGWPGAAVANATAAGMTQLSGIRQGNNSAYSRMGDGRSPAHFIGWRRPSASGSPYDAPGQESVLAPMNRRFVEWLQQQGGEGVGPRIPFDVYTDWDVDSGRLDVGDYAVLATSGHPEYWSRAAIAKLTQFTDGDPLAQPPISGGGSLINIGGNAFALSSEIDEANAVIEIKKWPTLAESVGEKDHESAISGGLIGEFPYVQRCSTPPRTDYRIFGTVRDIVVPCDPVPSCFGNWKVTDPAHWLWEDAVSLGERLALDTVGHEFDAFEASQPPPGGNVAVLAVGTDFSGFSPARSLNWSHPSFTLTSCAELDLLAFGQAGSPFWANRLSPISPTGEHGAVVAYDHRGGGRVLSFASTRAPLALEQDAKLSRLVYKAFRCFALGVDCP